MINHFSYLVLGKVLDADFDTIMKDIRFSTTPREVVTVGDMENYHAKMRAAGVEDYE